MYDYYCTGCGHKLTQRIDVEKASPVLFDMQYLLTGGIREFAVLKWRFTEEALYNIVSKNRDADGYSRIIWSFENIMEFISAPQSLNDEQLRTLTITQIRDFLDHSDMADAPKKLKKDLLPEDLIAIIGDAEEPSDAEEKSEESEKEIYEDPPAIRALIRLNKAATDESFKRDTIREDLQQLYNLFGQGNARDFYIKLSFLQTENGDEVLSGYFMRANGATRAIPNARVCPYCGQRIFKLAGTAEHQSIAFIGHPKSGKTSTILAVSDYILQAARGALGNAIWQGTNPIAGIGNTDRVDEDPKVRSGLADFSEGIAPNRTKAQQRTDAYSVTLSIRSEKAHLITLIDLPGELCHEEGEPKGANKQQNSFGTDINQTSAEVWEKSGIDADNVLNTWQVALNCDAYILCFDTSQIRLDNEAVKKIKAACIWADEFQKLRIASTNADRYIPTMVLFTKCAEIERESAEQVRKAVHFIDPVKNVYIFSEEAREMGLYDRKDNENPYVEIYRRSIDDFGEMGDLRKGYFAVLRSSPFGYAAPDNKEKLHHSPTPKNIDKLAKWILSVCGCVPVDAEYMPGDTDTPWRADNYYIGRKQYRIEQPNSKEESLARCYLFKNPGKYDRYWTEHFDCGKLVLLPFFGKMRYSPAGNAEGGEE